MPRRSTKTKADPSQGNLLDGPAATGGRASRQEHSGDRPWAPQGVSQEWIDDRRGWEERIRQAVNMSEADKLALLLSSLDFCPRCKRVVVVYQINAARIVMDPLPRERQAIADHLGSRLTAFGVRTPMLSLLGERIRQAHECGTPDVVPDPERGWKPGNQHNADIFDMG